MEVDRLQQEISAFMDLWIEKQGMPHNEQLVFNHVVEEIGELAREFVSRDIRKDKFSDEKMDNAIGDSLLHLIHLAQLRGINVEQLLLAIMEEDKKRIPKKY